MRLTICRVSLIAGALSAITADAGNTVHRRARNRKGDARKARILRYLF
jgi:hypothetical protein